MNYIIAVKAPEIELTINNEIVEKGKGFGFGSHATRHKWRRNTRHKWRRRQIDPASPRKERSGQHDDDEE